MTIKLLLVGKTNEENLQQLEAKYSKRVSHYINFKTEVLPQIKNAKKLGIEAQKTAEGQRILSNINSSDFLVLLDEHGKQYNSIQFSQFLQKRMNSGLKNLVFVIGGPFGFSKEVYAHAHSQMSLSRLTFSHQMVRPFFIEQLYRAFTILKNEPYHHQ